MPSDMAEALSVTGWAAQAQRLVKADDPAEIRRLETLCGCSQHEAVSHFIEASCCADDLPDFVGGEGTPEARRYALMALWKDYEGERHRA